MTTIKHTKIFGIGWPKTGTTSLGLALSMMGYRHCSYRDDLFRAAIKGNFDKLAEIIGRYDSFDDWPWIHFYREIDQRFPGSKFILTIRDEETLAASYLNMRRNQGPPKPVLQEFREFIYGSDPGADTFKECYRRHISDVTTYFRERPNDLLIIDWNISDSWSELERFTNGCRPNIPFPHANRGKYL